MGNDIALEIPFGRRPLTLVDDKGTETAGSGILIGFGNEPGDHPISVTEVLHKWIWSYQAGVSEAPR